MIFTIFCSLSFSAIYLSGTTLVISDVYNITADLSLPSDYDSLLVSSNVTEIGYKSFFGHRNIEQVNIGDSVKRIGDQSFSYCSNLQVIHVGKNVEEIGF